MVARRKLALLTGGTLVAAVALAGTGTSAPAASASDRPPGVVDVVQLGDAASERAHGVRVRGPSAAVRGEVEAGQLTEKYTARSVASGGSFTARIRVRPGERLSVQLKEIRPNDEWGEEYGYTIELDGVPFYVRPRDRADAGGGPYNSVFVDTADPAIVGDGRVDVTVVGTSTAPTYIGEIWSYADLAGMVQEQGMRVPDRVVFVLGQDYRGEQFFRSKLDYVASEMHSNDRVGLGMAVLDYFPVRTPEQMAANYRLWSQLSKEYGLPFAIEGTSDWEGTPSRVPDGKGGTFGDLKYQQILWSPQDRTGPDKDVWNGESLADLLGEDYDTRYGLSVPNIWGSTPWLTWRDPDLNAYYEKKANESLDAVRPLVWDLQRTDDESRILPFSTTLESTYWSKRDGKGVADQGYTEHNDGVERRDIYADYNPSTVAAAREDGVILDPTDGLSDTEKRWMYKNQSYPQQLFADIFYRGLPRERIEVSDSGVTFPTDLARHNVHSEVYSRLQEPYWSGVYPSLTQGILRHARPGSEYIELDDYSPGGFWHLQKSREFGRIANPNLENSVSGPTGKLYLLRQLYVNGSRYSSLYNWQTEGDDAVSGWVNEFIDDAHPWDVRRDDIPDGTVSGERKVSTSFTAGDLRLVDKVDVRISRVGEARPLQLTLTDDSGRVVGIRRLSPSELPSNGWASFEFPITELTEGKTYDIELEQVGGGAPAYDFPTVGGGLAVRVGLDMQAERDKSLVIQWRRDAADAIGNVTEDARPTDKATRTTLQAAKAALTAHRYVQAYRLAMKADSLRFPVLYQVRAGDEGALKPFPLSVTPGTDLDLDVTSYAPGRELSVTLAGYAAGEVEFSATGFGARPKVELDGVEVAVSDGRFTVSLPDTAKHHLTIRR